MAIIINPRYFYLRDFVSKVLDRTYSAQKIYRNFRNIVEDVTVENTHVVVKIFKKPTEFNRIVYTFLRPSKAKRAYDFSNRLLEAGIDVPEPIAYVEKKKGLFFHTGVFISLYTDYESVAYFNNLDINSEEVRLFIVAFSKFCADFHSKGFIHGDFNIDNILFKNSNETHYSFRLIDLNRMEFNNHAISKCAKDLASLNLKTDILDAIYKEYCQIRGLNYTAFYKQIQRCKNRSGAVVKLKDRILTPLGLRKKAPTEK